MSIPTTSSEPRDAGTVHLHKAHLEAQLEQHHRLARASWAPPPVSGEIDAARPRSWTIPVVVLTALVLGACVILAVFL